MSGKEKTHTKLENPKGKGGRPRITDQEQKDVRLLALRHTSKAVAVLKQLMLHGADNIKLQAATALLDRGFGKPIAVEERKIEQVIKVQHSDMELARRTAYLLSKAEIAEDKPIKVIERQYTGPHLKH